MGGDRGSMTATCMVMVHASVGGHAGVQKGFAHAPESGSHPAGDDRWGLALVATVVDTVLTVLAHSAGKY